MNKHDTSDRPLALVSAYGADAAIQRIEVSITFPKRRIVVAHTFWEYDGSKSMDEVIDKVMEFAARHNASQIQMIDRVLPISAGMNTLSRRNAGTERGMGPRGVWGDAVGRGATRAVAAAPGRSAAKRWGRAAR